MAASLFAVYVLRNHITFSHIFFHSLIEYECAVFTPDRWQLCCFHLPNDSRNSTGHTACFFRLFSSTLISLLISFALYLFMYLCMLMPIYISWLWLIGAHDKHTGNVNSINIAVGELWLLLEFSINCDRMAVVVDVVVVVVVTSARCLNAGHHIHTCNHNMIASFNATKNNTCITICTKEEMNYVRACTRTHTHTRARLHRLLCIVSLILLETVCFFNSLTASMRARSFCLRFMPRFYSFSELQLTFMFFYRSLKPFDGEFYVVYIALTHIRFYDRLFNGIFELNVRHHILNECVVRWHKPNQFVCLENILILFATNRC